MNTEKGAVTGGRSYYRTAEQEQDRLSAVESRIRRAKNIYLGVAVVLIILALGLGFLADRNLGLMVVIVAALVVFAGSMYVSRIFHREMH